MTESPPDLFTRLSQAREFLDAIEPMLPAYRSGIFSYTGIRHQGDNAILYARLELSTQQVQQSPKGPLETPSVFAGQACLSQLDPGAAEDCIRRAATGQYLPLVNNQILKLLPRSGDGSGDYDAYHDRSTLSQRTRKGDKTIDRLLLSGFSRFQLHNARLSELERDLQSKGVDSIEDLLRIYGLSVRDQTTLEIVTSPVAAFDSTTGVQGRHVVLEFRMASALRPELFNVFVRNADPNVLDLPHTLNGANVEWYRQGDWLRGRWNVEIDAPQILDCRIVYAGRPQAEWRLLDEDSLPNPRRMMLGVVDSQAHRLEQLVTSPKKNESEDFEAAVAWLFHMLGFTTVHVSAMSNMRDEPDILATGPNGEILLVECTTKVPGDDKLTLLISRTERMRKVQQDIQPADMEAGVVIPLMVCSLPPEELAGFRRKAEQHSIILLCQPELQEALERSRFAPNPEQLLKKWRDMKLMQLLTGERRLGGD